MNCEILVYFGIRKPVATELTRSCLFEVAVASMPVVITLVPENHCYGMHAKLCMYTTVLLLDFFVTIFLLVLNTSRRLSILYQYQRTR